jgi:hypothetical protein
MKRYQITLIALLGAFLVGCGTQATVVGANPGDNLNPAMSPAMRHAKMGGGKAKQPGGPSNPAPAPTAPTQG